MAEVSKKCLLAFLQVSNSSMVLTGGRVVNTATNLVTSHNLETGEVAVQKLEKKSEWAKDDFELWNLNVNPCVN